MKKYILVILVLFIGCGESSSSNNRHKLNQEQVDLVKEWQTLGLIDLEVEYHKVYIDTDMWRTMDYKLKKDMASLWSIYCGNRSTYDNYWIKIYDKMSGKLVGEKGAFGFKVH